jgi:nucleoid-associated protein YgaU
VRAPLSLSSGEQQQQAPPARAPLEPQASVAPAVAKEQPPASQPQEGGAGSRYKIRVVKQGETLSELIKQVYGPGLDPNLESSLMELVKRHNPSIINSNLIIAGSVIRFPEPPKKKK